MVNGAASREYEWYIMYYDTIRLKGSGSSGNLSLIHNSEREDWLLVLLSLLKE